MRFIILLKAEAYTKFLSFVVEHAHPSRPSHRWQEVIGFMFGKFAKNAEDSFEVLVTDVLPMDSGSAVYVKVGDYSTIYPYLTEKLTNEEFIVGWIHSHPGLGLFLSGTDVNTQTLYQQMDERAVAIVVDHTKITKSNPGLKAFRVTSEKDTNYKSYYEVDVQVEGITNFKAVLSEILATIELPELIVSSSLYPMNNIVQLDDFTLTLTGPSQCGRSDPAYFILKYESQLEGVVRIHYTPHIQGGKLLSPTRQILMHQPYNTGIVAVFQARPYPTKENLWPTALHLRLDNLIVQNVDGKMLFDQELNFVTEILTTT